LKLATSINGRDLEQMFVAAVGLVQIIIWLLSSVVLVRLASSTVGGEFASIRISGNLFILGIVYFILGYLFFAVLQAAIGAIGVNVKESQQMTVALILPAVLPIYLFIFFLRDNPDHVIGTVLTMIPVTAPTTVFIRLGISEIPAWELVVSIVLPVAGIIGGVVLAAKIFRTFLLMYGKTPRIGEVIRTLRKA
jgi:ABC-2 type transport system permease protein